MNNRRKLVIALGAGALAAPFALSLNSRAKSGASGSFRRSRPATIRDLRRSSSNCAISATWKARPSPSIICRRKGSTIGCRPLPPNWSGATWTSSWRMAGPRRSPPPGTRRGRFRSSSWVSQIRWVKASWPASRGPAAMSRASPTSNGKRQASHLRSSRRSFRPPSASPSCRTRRIQRFP